MSASTVEIWIVILGLAVGTFLIRFSFLGLIGGRDLPRWLLRHLRYTPVAVIPGLVTPLLIWPEATGGSPDPARLIAAAVTLIAGLWSKNVVIATVCGAASLVAGLNLF